MCVEQICIWNISKADEQCQKKRAQRKKRIKLLTINQDTPPGLCNFLGQGGFANTLQHKMTIIMYIWIRYIASVWVWLHSSQTLQNNMLIFKKENKRHNYTLDTLGMYLYVYDIHFRCCLCKIERERLPVFLLWWSRWVWKEASLSQPHPLLGCPQTGPLEPIQHKYMGRVKSYKQ